MHMQRLASLGLLIIILASCSKDPNIVIPEASLAVVSPDTKYSGDANAVVSPIEEPVIEDSLVEIPDQIEAESARELPVPEPLPMPASDQVQTPSSAPAQLPVPETLPTPASKPQTIANGWYLFKAMQSGRCLDIPDGNASIGTQVQIWECNPTNNHQRFYLEFLSDGRYKIRNANGRFLEGSSGTPSDGAPLRINEYKGISRQMFEFVPIAEGSKTYRIRISDTILFADVAGSATQNGAWLQIANQTAESNQHFALLVAP